MKTYSLILQGHEATYENAKTACHCIDWQSEETETITFEHGFDYVETINGVDIYYHYRADYYFFAPNEKN